MTIAFTLIYYDQRVRKEGFDLATDDVHTGGRTSKPGRCARFVMPASRFAPVLLLICLWLAVAAVAESGDVQQVLVYQPRVFSLGEYASELDRLAIFARRSNDDPNAAAAAIAELRGGWEMQADGRVFKIPTEGIFDQFEKLQKHSDNQLRDSLLERIAALKADAQAYQEPAVDTAASRTTLTQILARSEFHQVHGPTWLDRLKYKIGLWLFRMLSRFFDSSSVPVIGRSLVWTLLAVAVLALAWFIYREMKRNAHIESIMPEVLSVSAKQWQVWMAEAQAVAAKGLWRDAVHLAYWAGISFLEERGMWRPDQARTPREYLRLISATSEHRPALSTLTRQLEVTWYGNQLAGPETFAETLTHLENLGCRHV